MVQYKFNWYMLIMYAETDPSPSPYSDYFAIQTTLNNVLTCWYVALLPFPFGGRGGGGGVWGRREIPDPSFLIKVCA